MATAHSAVAVNRDSRFAFQVVPEGAAQTTSLHGIVRWWSASAPLGGGGTSTTTPRQGGNCESSGPLTPVATATAPAEPLYLVAYSFLFSWDRWAGSVPPMRLVEYPHVVVRVACVLCQRRGRLRLARLAEQYGADANLDAVLDGLRFPCPYPLPDPTRRAQRKLSPTCGVYLPDLAKLRPPDRAQPELDETQG